MLEKQEPKKKTKVWFEKNPPKAETGVQNGVFLQRRYKINLPRLV